MEDLIESLEVSSQLGPPVMPLGGVGECQWVVAGGWRILNKPTLWTYLVLSLLCLLLGLLLSEVDIFPYLLLIGVYLWED